MPRDREVGIRLQLRTVAITHRNDRWEKVRILCVYASTIPAHQRIMASAFGEGQQSRTTESRGASTMARISRPRLQPETTTVSRWPATVALALIGVGYLVLSDRFRIGPPWLVLLLVVVFLIPINVTRRLGAFHFTRAFVLGILALVTIAVVTSALFLVVQLASGNKTPALTLLRDGTVIWLANVNIFALWYWEIDCGGPIRRLRQPYRSTDFLFPQRSVDENAFPDWSPEFVDYLFLAFNTSAAFSPTDTLILSRPAKVLMMVQSLVSIVILAVLIARAINTLS